MGSSEEETISLDEALDLLNKTHRKEEGVSAFLDDSIQGIPHKDIVKVLKLLVSQQISDQNSTKEKFKKLEEETEDKFSNANQLNEEKISTTRLLAEERNEETMFSLEKLKEETGKLFQNSEQKLQNLDKVLAKTNKELSKGVEARAGVPFGQALSVEERDQLDFFLQSPGIGMIFLAVAFGVSGEDASGALQAAVQKGEFMKMAEQAAEDFPGFTKATEDTSFKVNSDMKSEFKKFLDFSAEVRKDEDNFLEKIDDGLAVVIQTAGADLKVVLSTVKGQMQSKSDFFRETILPSIVHELKENASCIEGKFEKIEKRLQLRTTSKTYIEDLRYIKDILKNFELFFSSDLYEKFLSEIIASISKEFKKSIKKRVVHLQRHESTIQDNETVDDDSGTRDACMIYVKGCIRPMLEALAKHRKDLWKNVMECISAHPFTVASRSDMSSKIFYETSSLAGATTAAPALAAAKAKILQDAERKYLHAVQKLAANLSKKLAEPTFEKIPETVLYQMLKMKNLKIEEFFTHQIVSYELEYVGTELKSRLKRIFVDKLQQRAQKHPRLKLFLDVATESKGCNWYRSIAQLWHRSWKIQNPGEETKRHGIAHGLSNMITVALPLFVLLVQFAYLFFVWYELYQVYNGGVCPGYKHGHRMDSSSGASKEIRILVGFVGAYFVMKNGSKLFKYLKALEGNHLTNSSSLLKLLPFANVFMNCPEIVQVEKVMKEGLAQLIIDSARSLLNSTVPSLSEDEDDKAFATCNQCFGSKKPDFKSELVTVQSGPESVYVAAWAFGSNSVETSPAELSAGDGGRVAEAPGIDVQMASSVHGTTRANLVDSKSGMCAENLHCSGGPPVTVSGMRFGETSQSTDSSDPAPKPKIIADTRFEPVAFLHCPFTRLKDLNLAHRSQWRIQEVSKSKLYHVFCIDLLLSFFLTSLVVLNNMYIVFVSGGTAQEILKQVVILDFILGQSDALKKELFSGASGKAVLRAIKAAFEYGLNEDTEGGHKTKRDKQCGASNCKCHEDVCCFCGSNVAQQSKNPNWTQKSGQRPGKCPGCKRPLKHLCGFCCCSSKACVRSCIVPEEHDFDSIAERNEAVRRIFEFVLQYFLGFPLMALSVAFIIYAPICKPGVGDLAVVNITA